MARTAQDSKLNTLQRNHRISSSSKKVNYSGSWVRSVTFLSQVIRSESRAEKFDHFYFLIIWVTLIIDEWNGDLDEIK